MTADSAQPHTSALQYITHPRPPILYDNRGRTLRHIPGIINYLYNITVTISSRQNALKLMRNVNVG